MYDVCTARTNIDIDDELIQRVMQQRGYRTKREAVEQALRRLDMQPATKEELLALRGTGWDGDLDEMRSNRFPDWGEPEE